MKIATRKFRIRHDLLALSILAVYGTAHAEDEDVALLVNPQSSMSVGAGAATGNGKERSVFGQYNGWRLDGAKLLLDADVIKRDDEQGLWTTIEARNLGLDTKEFRFSQNRQGDWKYMFEYNEMVRRDPRIINTGLVFSQTTTPSVVSLTTPGSGRDIDLDIRRKATSLSAEKWLTESLLFEASVRSEERNGARLSGTGVACMPPGFSSVSCSSLAAAMIMLPEPVSTTTKLFEAKLNYSGEKYLLSGGYYGSFFSNANGSIYPGVGSNLYNPDGSLIDIGTTPGSTLAGYLSQPIALPPDNQAHQFYVDGNYAFTSTTRTTFKYSFTHATQNADFASLGLSGAPAGVGNLGGVMDSALLQAGFTARPMAKLSMLANLRYEDKADKTPLALYNGSYTNDLNSSRRLNGKIEASYKLPDNYRATLGADYSSRHHDRPVSTAPVWSAATAPMAGLREDTRELGCRAELQRSMSDTINASIAYVQSRRDGGGWINVGTYNAAGAYPMNMADRTRNKIKISADWSPTGTLSFQFMLENGKDTFSSPSDKGLRDTGMSAYGVDAAWSISENWKLTGYVNQASQTLHVDHNVGYLAELANTNTSVGVGIAGKPGAKLELGADLSVMDDINRYRQAMATGAAIVGGGLPDVQYRVTRLSLFGKYALQKNGNLRVDLIHQSLQFDEWTWSYNGVPFTYSDNTTVTMQPTQSVNFLGARYVYLFR